MVLNECFGKIPVFEQVGVSLYVKMSKNTFKRKDRKETNRLKEKKKILYKDLLIIYQRPRTRLMDYSTGLLPFHPTVFC